MKHAIPLLALFALAGCGKAPDPATPAPAPAPAPNTAAEPLPPLREAVHELDPAKHVIPAQLVSGRVGGRSFRPDRVELDGNVLTFRQGAAYSPDVQLMLVLQENPAADKDTRVVVRPEQKSTEGIPVLALSVKEGGDLKNTNLTEGYALTLDLGKPEGGHARGKVHLSLPGADKGVIAGTFDALHDRPATSPPAAGDRPFITGGIAHAGKPDATLIAGYVRLPAAGQEPIYDTVQTTVKDDPIGAVRSSAHKPRTATLRPNEEGKGAEYDMTKLPPGKYLVAARLEGGIPAWAVREVKADSELKVPLELKATAAGQVEVVVPGLPDDAMVQVQVLPAEVAVADATGEYEAHAGLVLGSWTGLEKGKATIKQLPPGEYVASARNGDARYTAKVTVKAGETAKAELKPTP